MVGWCCGNRTKIPKTHQFKSLHLRFCMRFTIHLMLSVVIFTPFLTSVQNIFQPRYFFLFLIYVFFFVQCFRFLLQDESQLLGQNKQKTRSKHKLQNIVFGPFSFCPRVYIRYRTLTNYFIRNICSFTRLEKPRLLFLRFSAVRLVSLCSDSCTWLTGAQPDIVVWCRSPSSSRFGVF